MAARPALRELAVRAVRDEGGCCASSGSSPDTRAPVRVEEASSASRTDASGYRARGAGNVEASYVSSLGERLGPRLESARARPSDEVINDNVEGSGAWDGTTGSSLGPTSAAADGPTEGCSEESVGSRAQAVLLGDGERPRATYWGRAVTEVTNGFILRFRHAISKFWAARANDVKRACAEGMPTGLIDEYDVLAFVLADALGQPLLHPDDTNKFGKRVASKVTRLEDHLAKIDGRADAVVRRARDAAAADPSKLPRVAEAEEAGRAERAELLAKPYDPAPPQTTVGGKRARSDGEMTTQVQALGRAVAAVERAKDDVERRKRATERVGAVPVPPCDSAALHMWRRHDREAAAASDAAAHLQEAQARLAKKQRQVIQLGEEAEESLERSRKEREERLQKSAELTRCSREVGRRRRAELSRYFELYGAYRFTKDEDFEYEVMEPGKQFINVVEASDNGNGDVDFDCAWMMVTGTGIGPPPPMEKPVFPPLPFEHSEHSPQWIERCRRKGVSPLINPDELDDHRDVVDTSGLPHLLDYACWPSIDRPCGRSTCRHCATSPRV
jgi:hypothetical protein